MSQDVSRFFRHSTIYAIGNALNRMGAFLLLPIYTRHLAPAEYGALETFYMVSAIVSGMLAVGIGHATLRFYFDHERLEDRHAVVSSNLLASMAIATAGVAALWPWGGLFTAWLFQGHDFGSAYHWMLATIVFELSSQVALSYLRAIERSLLFIAVSFAKLIVQVVVNSVALLVLDAGVAGVLAGNCLTVLLGWAVLSGVVVRDCGLRFSWEKLVPVLRYSLPFLGTTVVGIAAATADRFLVQSLVSLEALGVYALATKFSKLVSDLVGEPVNRAYGAFRYTIMNAADAALTQSRVTRYLAVLLTTFGLGVSVLTPDLLRVIATPAFRDAGLYVPWLALAAVLQIIVYPLQTGIFYAKRTGLLVWVSGAQSAVGVVVGALLIWQFGVLGACLTLLTSAVVTVVMTWRFSQRHFAVDYDWGRLIRMLALAAVACTGAMALPELALWLSVPIRLGLVALFLAGVVLTGVIERAELEQALAALRQWRLRRGGQS